MTTEKLQKHIERLEKDRTSLFFEMQKIASGLDKDVYFYNTIILICAFILLLASNLISSHHTLIMKLQNIMTSAVIITTLLQYLYTLKHNVNAKQTSICDLYKNVDNEYYILKKFSIGEIEENVVEQFFKEKTKSASKHDCTLMQNKINLVYTINTILLIISTVLLFAI